MQLRKWLKENGMTQQELARKVHHTQPFICGVLNGFHCDVKISLLRKLHRITKIPMPVLVDDFLRVNRPFGKERKKK